MPKPVTKAQLHRILVEVRRCALLPYEEQPRYFTHTCGICFNAQEVCEEFYGESRTVEGKLEPLFYSWEHYSGDISYPIKGGWQMYDAMGNKYVGEYGKLRLALLDHMIALTARKGRTMPDQLNKKRLCKALRQVRRNALAGKYTINGICSAAYEVYFPDYDALKTGDDIASRLFFYNQLASLFEGWPQHSGRRSYLIPPPIGVREGEVHKWKGEQLELRLSLLTYTINKLARTCHA